MGKIILGVTLAAFFLLSGARSQDQNANFKPLFNGKDLTGWKHVGPGEMTVEDGLIHTHGGMGLLYWSEQTRQLPHSGDLQNARSQQ